MKSQDLLPDFITPFIPASRLLADKLCLYHEEGPEEATPRFLRALFLDKSEPCSYPQAAWLHLEVFPSLPLVIFHNSGSSDLFILFCPPSYRSSLCRFL